MSNKSPGPPNELWAAVEKNAAEKNAAVESFFADLAGEGPRQRAAAPAEDPLAEIKARLDRVEARLARIEPRLDPLDAIKARLDALDGGSL